MSHIDRGLYKMEAINRCEIVDLRSALDEYDEHDTNKDWTHDQYIGYLEGISRYLDDQLYLLNREKEELERLKIDLESERCRYYYSETEEKDDDT